MQTLRFGLVGIASLLLLAACGGEPEESAPSSHEDEAAEQIVEKAIRMSGGEDVDVDIQGDDVRIGDLTISKDRLPKDFPTDVAIYKDAKLLNSASSPEDHSFAATWTTDDDHADVLAFIEEKMHDSGWQTETSMETGNRTILEYAKDERGVAYMIASNDKSTTISFSTGDE